MKVFHFWQIPVATIFIWYSLLIAMLTCWGVQGRPIYWFMSPKDQFIYLSDIAATNLKPIFISCGAAQGVLFIFTLISEGYLRWKAEKLIGYFNLRLPRITIILSVIFAMIGAAGVTICACLDIAHHKYGHYTGLGMFIVGIFFCVVCLLIEQFSVAINYGKNILSNYHSFNGGKSVATSTSSSSSLEMSENEHDHTNDSSTSPQVFDNNIKVFKESIPMKHNYLFWASIFKLVWGVIAVVLAICFGLFAYYGNSVSGPICEWILCFWYGGIHMILAYDFIPASRYKWKPGFYGQGKYNHGFDYNVIPRQKEFETCEPNIYES